MLVYRVVYPRTEPLKIEVTNDRRGNEWAIKTKAEPALNEPLWRLVVVIWLANKIRPVNVLDL